MGSWPCWPGSDWLHSGLRGPRLRGIIVRPTVQVRGTSPSDPLEFSWFGLILIPTAVATLEGRATADEAGPTPTPTAPTLREVPVPVPEPTPEALRFYRTGLWLWGLGRIWGIAVPAVILFTGFSGRIRAVRPGTRGALGGDDRPLRGRVSLGRIPGRTSPSRYYAGFVRLHEYGLSVESFGRWLGDSLKGLGVQMAGAVLFLWIPYLLIARRPRRCVDLGRDLRDDLRGDSRRHSSFCGAYCH